MMAATRRDIPLTGILVPDPRIRTAGAESTIATGGSSTTSYSQAGPTAPGAVDLGDDVVVGLSGDMASSVYLDIGRGGSPDPARGARLRWADSSSDTLLGWAPPPWIRHTTGTTDLGASDITDAIALQSGLLLVASADGDGAVVESATYDPTTDTWTEGGDLPWVATAASPTEALLALWQDPDDGTIYALQTDVTGAALTRRMLVQSTDDGATWTTVAQASFSGGTIESAARKCRWWRLPSGDHVLVVMSATVLQLWTSTSGEDWRYIGELTGIEDGLANRLPAADVALLPDGRLLWVYVESADRTICYARLTSPLQDPATAAAVTVATQSNNHNGLSLSIEETGRAWVMADVANDGVRVYRSISYTAWLEDDGNRLLADGDATIIEHRRSVPLAGGHALVMGDWTGTAATAAPVVMLLGGWGSIEPWSVATGLSARDSDRLTWGASSTTTVPWLGATANQQTVDLTAAGWTRIDTGGSETVGPDVRTIDSTAGSYYYSETISGGTDSALAFFDVAIVTTGSIGSALVGWRVNADTGATGQNIICAISSTQFRVSEVGGSTLVTVTADMTERMQFMVCIESGNRLEVYYKRPYERAWTSAYQTGSPNLTGTGGAANVRWGHLFGGTEQSTWRFVGFVASTSSASATAKRDQWRSSGSTAASRAQILGRPLGSYGGSLGDPTTHPLVSLLSVAPTGGATATVAPAYAYPIDAIDPIASPSPRQRWRSTDETEQIIEWELDDTLDEADIPYLALHLAGANFRTANLEYWTGSTWDDVCEVDLGEAVNYTRTGNTVYASSGTPRWMQHAELVGGGFVDDNGDHRTVAANTSGYGSDAELRTRVRLSDATVADPASGSGALLFPRGVAAALAALDVRRIRLRIPAQSTRDGYFELGIAAIGRLYVLGTPEDFGSGQTVLLDVDEQERPGYTVRDRRSPPRRRWTLQVAEASLLGIRDGVAGYLSPDGATGMSVGLEGDVVPLLEGLLADGMDASPVLVLPVPPETEIGNSGYTTTETRRDVLWWGRLTSVAWDIVTGRIGESELHRIPTFTIDEDV